MLKIISTFIMSFSFIFTSYAFGNVKHEKKRKIASLDDIYLEQVNELSSKIEERNIHFYDKHSKKVLLTDLMSSNYDKISSPIDSRYSIHIKKKKQRLDQVSIAFSISDKKKLNTTFSSHTVDLTKDPAREKIKLDQKIKSIIESFKNKLKKEVSLLEKPGDRTIASSHAENKKNKNIDKLEKLLKSVFLGAVLVVYSAIASFIMVIAGETAMMRVSGKKGKVLGAIVYTTFTILILYGGRKILNKGVEWVSKTGSQ